jgi:hypothetical protein
MLRSEPAAQAFLWIYFLFISLFNTYIMLGLVLAVITGTFKEAGSGTTSRVSPEQDLETKIMDLQLQCDFAEGIGPRTTKASPAHYSLNSQADGDKPASQLKGDYSDNGEVMLRLWAQVRVSY